LQAGGPGFESP